MPKHVLLNNITHKDLKVITDYSANYGDNVSVVVTFPTEYADIQREYPILFRRDAASGEVQSVALLGFEKHENLFLNEGGWSASYVPGIIARGPFLIGFQEQEIDGDIRKEAVIHVDMDSPRISHTYGEPVFLPHGGNTEYLERVAGILNGIHEGMAISKLMFQAYEAFELIEPVSLEILLSSERVYNLNGYYTISREKLSILNGEQLATLNKAGFLEGAFLVMASLTNVKKLIDLKNRRTTSAGIA